MNDITPQQAKSAVLGFLQGQFEKKSETEQKQLAKAKEDGDAEKFAELTLKIAEIREKYALEPWMERAANWMTKQIGFGTHISKGIHSSSRGDNINFSTNNLLPHGIVGHQSLREPILDASGNAAALPLFSLFDFDVNDGRKVKHYIIENEASFHSAFSNNEKISKTYFDIFRNLLLAQPTEPKSSELNKQTLWWHVDKDSYTCLIPLYPSSFTHYIYEHVNYSKYSDKYSQARKNRYNKSSTVEAYPDMLNIAVTKIGGSNPQGVSQLMSKQGGRNYLLPSLPPMIGRDFNFRLSKFKRSIFDNNALIYPAREAIQDIFSVMESTNKNVDIRNTRKEAIDNVLHILFGLVHSIRTRLPAGWSKDFALDMPYKYWLDPKRPALPDEEEFALGQTKEDWHEIIINHFADWLNALLKAEFPKQSSDIAYPEHKEWKREIEAMKKQYEREGRGIF